jgi:nitroreductase/NAD-dependent dihydropyrimidine dehydrogenase PreA subunit
MPIIGIDYEKCINCGNCRTICFLFSRSDKENDKIIFQGPQAYCNLCGHCIAVCPEDAILYEGIGEAYAYEGVDKPENIASFDTVYKILRANRSIRRYKKEKVPTEILKKVFEAMEHAPTGSNMRSEKFLILSDEEQIRTLSDAVQEELFKNPLMSDRYKEIFAIMKKIFRSPIYFDAPHVIFVYSSTDLESEANNIGIIITYGRLAAQALGLGTCWNGLTQIAMMSNPKIKKLAGMRGRKVGVFTIGYPDVTYYRSPPRSAKRIKGLEM